MTDFPLRQLDFVEIILYSKCTFTNYYWALGDKYKWEKISAGSTYLIICHPGSILVAPLIIPVKIEFVTTDNNSQVWEFIIGL